MPTSSRRDERGRMPKIALRSIDEAMLRKLGEQPLGLVAAPVADELVECRPARLVQGRGQQQSGARRGDARQLRERAVVVIDVLDDIERANEIEGAVGERQRRDRALDGSGAARAQLRERRSADVDEVRAFDRQPGPQARRDFQPARACGTNEATSGQVLKRCGSTKRTSAHRAS